MRGDAAADRQMQMEVNANGKGTVFGSSSRG